MNANGASRLSSFIKRKPASNLHHATRFAAIIGRPLNQSVAINFAKTSVSEGDVAERFHLLRATRFAPWLRRHPKNKKGCPPTYVWVLEAAGNQIGAHWAVHIPRGMVREFRRRLPLWIASVAGEPEGPGVMKARPIYNITGLKRYMLKGVDPAYGALYRVRPVDQGVVVGRRSGFSRNLGPTVRKEAGYRPQRAFSVPR